MYGNDVTDTVALFSDIDNDNGNEHCLQATVDGRGKDVPCLATVTFACIQPWSNALTGFIKYPYDS